jgi:hypothetical protein
MLGLSAGDVGRFRDAYIADGKIAIYTRNGGGNRECWETHGDGDDPGCSCPGCIIEEVLPQHPHYLYDEDDDFDSTYATIYFSFPTEYAEALSLLGEDEKPEQVWQDFLTTVDHGEADPTSDARGQKAARQFLLAIRMSKKD